MRIAALYAIESRGQEMSIAERSHLQQPRSGAACSNPCMPGCKETRITVANGGGTAKAIDYSLKRWPALCRYASHGALPIDNNPVENAIRPVCLGKKNWLFVGSERAGKRAASKYRACLSTATLNGLDPCRLASRHAGEAPDQRLDHNIDSLLPLRSLS